MVLTRRTNRHALVCAAGRTFDLGTVLVTLQQNAESPLVDRVRRTCGL
jgi:hypothetical protein